MKKYYESFDHTGDIGLEIWGGSIEELFENSCRTLTDTIVKIDHIVPIIESTWSVEADSLESLLIRLLEEILYQMDAKGIVFCEFHVRFTAPTQLTCLAKGEVFDRERHGFKTEIKAVTYHRLKIWQEKDGPWCARVILDV